MKPASFLDGALFLDGFSALISCSRSQGVLWFECGMSSTGSCAPTCVFQQVVLFEKVAVGGKVLLEEVGHWGTGGLGG